MSHFERNMHTKREIAKRTKELQDELDFLNGIFTGCGTCVSRGRNGGCEKAGGEIPPVEVQQTGCPEWYWDDIPF